VKLVRPTTVDDTVLVSSNVPESEAVYNAGTTYGAGAIVRGTGADAHLRFESLQAGNVGHPLHEATDPPTWWLATGATNRYAMFDGSVQAQTTHADLIDVTLSAPGRSDCVALLNVSGVTAQVTVTDAVDGVVYDRTKSLVSSSGITDWYAYFFEPIERLSDVVFDDIPPYAGATIEAKVAETGVTVGCGELVVGFSKKIGDTQWGPQLGITDFSLKDTDAFGNVTVAQRAFHKLGSFNLVVRNTYVDQLERLLSRYRATPILYVGDPDFTSMAVYGFFRSFQIVVPGPAASFCSLDVESVA
jgi:hypothetical protein